MDIRSPVKFWKIFKDLFFSVVHAWQSGYRHAAVDGCTTAALTIRRHACPFPVEWEQSFIVYPIMDLMRSVHRIEEPPRYFSPTTFPSITKLFMESSLQVLSRILEFSLTVVYINLSLLLNCFIFKDLTLKNNVTSWFAEIKKHRFLEKRHWIYNWQHILSTSLSSEGS